MATVPDLTYFNSNSLSVSFSFNYHATDIPFLDVNLRGNTITGQIETITYCKEISENTIRSARSCHPAYTVRAIPLGELT